LEPKLVDINHGQTSACVSFETKRLPFSRTIKELLGWRKSYLEFVEGLKNNEWDKGGKKKRIDVVNQGVSKCNCRFHGAKNVVVQT